MEVTLALTARLLVLSDLADDESDARAKASHAIGSGKAAEAFARMVVALDGPADLLERPEAHLAAAPIQEPVYPAEAGVVAAVDTRAVGIAVVELGGGRRRVEDLIDPAVGFAQCAAIGEHVAPNGRPLAVVHARDAASAQAAADSLRAAVSISAEAVPAGSAVLDYVGG